MMTEAVVDVSYLKDLSSQEKLGTQIWNDLFINTVEPTSFVDKGLEFVASDQTPTVRLKTNEPQHRIKSATSNFMLGSVAVGMIFVESRQSDGAKTGPWADEDKTEISMQVYAGLDWWAQTGGYRANLSWTYDIMQCTTQYEPMEHTKNESPLWVNECMDQLGYSEGADYIRTRAYVNDLRRKYSTDWSFVIFVVDAHNDTDGYFADRSGITWAYVGGPYLVLSNKCAGWSSHNIWRIVAHETGHIFNAMDEYLPDPRMATAKISDTDSALNQIHAQELCMMKTNDPFLCDDTRIQIGWIDHNRNGIYDPYENKKDTLFHYEQALVEGAFMTKAKVLFYENFTWKGDWYEDALNYVQNGKYYMFDSTYGSSSWLERSYDDFTASVGTQWIQGSAVSGYGLMVRAKTATDGYIFFINHHGQFSFGKYVNSSWKYLAPWTYSDFIRNEGENILTAKCIANRFTLFINGMQVADVSDDTFLYGNVGLTVLPGVQVTFDDLSMISP